MRDEPEYIPPPPSTGGTPRQALLVMGLGVALIAFVLYALNQSNDRESILETAVILIVLGLVFGAGMISRSELVQYITAGIMMFGGGIAIGLGMRNDQAFWYVGALLFFVCAVIIVIKDQLIERDSS